MAKLNPKSSESTPKLDLSYEDARGQLVEIVTSLEQGSIPLEESIALWERGEKLAQHCQAWLNGARQRIEAAQESCSTNPIEEN